MVNNAPSPLEWPPGRVKVQPPLEPLGGAPPLEVAPPFAGLPAPADVPPLPLAPALAGLPAALLSPPSPPSPPSPGELRTRPVLPHAATASGMRKNEGPQAKSRFMTLRAVSPQEWLIWLENDANPSFDRNR